MDAVMPASYTNVNMLWERVALRKRLPRPRVAALVNGVTIANRDVRRTAILLPVLRDHENRQPMHAGCIHDLHAARRIADRLGSGEDTAELPPLAYLLLPFFF